MITGSNVIKKCLLVCANALHAYFVFYILTNICMVCKRLVGGQESGQIGRQVSRQVGRQVGRKVGRQLRRQVSKQVQKQIDNGWVGKQISGQISGQVAKKVGEQVGRYVGEKEGNQVSSVFQLPLSSSCCNSSIAPALPSSAFPLSLSLFTQKVCEPGPFRALFKVCHLASALFFFFFWILVPCMEFFFVAGFGIRVNFCHAPSTIMRRLGLVVQSLIQSVILLLCCVFPSLDFGLLYGVFFLLKGLELGLIVVTLHPS